MEYQKLAGDAAGAAVFGLHREGEEDITPATVEDYRRSLDEFERSKLLEVEARVDLARSLEERSLTSPRADAAWTDAEEVVRRLPHYRGVELERILGLLPLGKNPRTDLLEFWLIPTGDEPKPGPAGTTGRWKIEENTGMVFVLVPGGEFRMGAHPPTLLKWSGQPNVDIQACPNEYPVHVVRVDPFFISKYELTQAQWLRFDGSNPASFQPDTPEARRYCDLSHPVEQVSWFDCIRVLRRLQCTLPTEAQWEYAARARTSSVWSSGGQKEDLLHYANLASGGEGRDDGFAAHAPVGSFLPNAFGLHDVHGNVWEWCLDTYELYPDEARSSTARGRPAGSQRVVRGGGFRDPPKNARSSVRGQNFPDISYSIIGVRPVLDIRGRN